MILKHLRAMLFLLLPIATVAGAQTYKVNIVQTDGGNITSSATIVKVGETVTLTVTPQVDKYVEEADIYIEPTGDLAQTRTGVPEMGETWHPIAGTDQTPEGQGSYTFTMPQSNVTIHADFHQRTDMSTATVTLGKDNDGAGTLPPYAFDGNEHKPTVTSVVFDSKTLSVTGVPDNPGRTVNGKQEYDVVYPLADYAARGDSKDVCAKGRGKYMGLATAYFTISAKDISTTDVDVTLPSLIYNTFEQRAPITINDHVWNHTLVEGVDYVLENHEHINAGTYPVKVTAFGDYTGERTENFVIQKLDLSTTTLTLSQYTYEYDGITKHPTITVKTAEGVDIPSDDYVLTIQDNRLVGTATITVSGTEVNTTGSKSVTFSITKRPLTITALPQTVTYGTPIIRYPDALITDNLVSGVLDTDNSTIVHSVSEIKLTASTNQVTTNGTITPSEAVINDGSGNNVATSYSITYVPGNLTILPKDFSSGDVSISGLEDSYVYTGQSISPVPTIKNTEIDETLVLGKDYDVSYENNLNVGTATLTVTFKGNYSGSTSRTFNITQRPVTITAKKQTIVYGTDITLGTDMAESEGLAEGHTLTAITLTLSTDLPTTDGTIKPSAAVIKDAAGTEVTANYDITYATGVLIIMQEISDNLNVADISNYVYTGQNIEPKPVVKDLEKVLAEGTDYDLSYRNNLNAGTATVIVTFKGNYSGVLTPTFLITKKPATVTAKPQSITYGQAIAQGTDQVSAAGLIEDHTLTAITLTPSTDQPTADGTVTPSAAIIKDAVGTEVTANYDITFESGVLTIMQEAGDNLSVSDISSYVYTGQAIVPKPVVKDLEKVLVEGTDYDLSYQNNLNVGTATVIVTFKGNYSGVLTPTFLITKKPATVTAKPQYITYGQAIAHGTDQVSAVGLIEGHTLTAITLTPSTDQPTTDGTVTPSAAIIKDAAGTDVTANYDITFETGVLTILQEASDNLSVASISNYVYTGQNIEPKPVVKDLEKVLTEGTDYDLSYRNNLNVGTATVIVTFKGNYSGALAPTFLITQKPATVTAKPQSITYGKAIANGADQVSAEGLIEGHTLTAITLTPSTDQPTTDGTVTPSAANIKDAAGTDVTANYSITYVKGKLVIENQDADGGDVEATIGHDKDGNPEAHITDVADKDEVTIPETITTPDGQEVPVTVIDADAFRGKENIHDIYLLPKNELVIKDPTFGGWATPAKGARVHVYQTLLKTYGEGQLKDLVDAGLLVTDIENVNRMFTFSNAFNTIIPEGVRQYTCRVDGNMVHRYEVKSDVIASETGVLLIGDPGLHIFVATKRENAPSLYAGNDLVPVMESLHISEVSYAYLLTGNEFHKMNLINSIPDGKAYLKWPDPQTYEAASTRLSVDGGETGIVGIGYEDAPDRWYDLQGRRCDEGTMKAGVYIHNGKKVVIKRNK